MAYSLAEKPVTSTTANVRPNQGKILELRKAKNHHFITSARAHLSGSAHCHLKMGLSRKRKQQLREITSRSLETRKLRKFDQESPRRKEILRRQEMKRIFGMSTRVSA